jgi:STAS domain
LSADGIAFGIARGASPATDLSVHVTPHCGGLRATVEGELDLATVSTLFSSLVPHADSQALLLDLRALRFIDVVGLRGLLELQRTFCGRLRVIPGDACRRLFEVANVGEVLPLVDP